MNCLNIIHNNLKVKSRHRGTQSCILYHRASISYSATKILDEDRQLLKRDTDETGNRIYILADKAKQEYFIN